ncbi:MAG: hypothetical protein WD646_10310 [Actinomycetota bacterium]
MAVTNIELYEALKKDVSEESARMIAEIVPAAGDLTTKTDFSGLEARFAEFEMRLERRMSSFERRFLLLFALPLWSAVAAGLVKLFIG